MNKKHEKEDKEKKQSLIEYERPMNDMLKEKKKKLIGQGELIGLICGPRKEISKLRERQ